jgi:hypothetical protein
MTFFRQHARFIVPLPFLLLALMKAWEAMHDGSDAQFLASVGFFGVAILSYWGQQHIYLERRKSLKDGIAKR